MKIGRFTLSGVSIVLLVIQLLIVSSIAGKYLWQRWRCPRVWTRAAAIDPELPMRGRYLSLQLTVDGCQSTLPSAKFATFPRDVNGAIKPGPYVLRPRPVLFRANLKVQNNQLVALRESESAAGRYKRRRRNLSCARRALQPDATIRPRRLLHRRHREESTAASA